MGRHVRAPYRGRIVSINPAALSLGAIALQQGRPLFHPARASIIMMFLTCGLAAGTGGFKFSVASRQDRLFPPVEFILRGPVANGRVQPTAVVLLYISGGWPPCIIKRGRCPGR